MTSAKAIYPDLSQKTVAITGGASGIGAAIVAAFQRQGARVVFFDIDKPAGESLAERLGAKTTFMALDLTDLEALSDVFAQAINDTGGFDVLVNNAAHDDRHDIDSVTPAYWRERLAINLDHQFFSAQAVIPGMRQRRAGSIINMSSIAWRIGLARAPAYVASKAAVEGLTHSLARELGEYGVRVNCLLPGYVRTQRQLDNWITPEIEERIKSDQCLPGFIEPEDIADVILMLASDSSKAITNQTIVVDAGWT